jgi:hypothetical protein
VFPRVSEFSRPHPVMAILDITIKQTPLIENLLIMTTCFYKNGTINYLKNTIRPRVILLSAIMKTYIVYSDKYGKTLEKRKLINYSI